MLQQSLGVSVQPFGSDVISEEQHSFLFTRNKEREIEKRRNTDTDRDEKRQRNEEISYTFALIHKTIA